MISCAYSATSSWRHSDTNDLCSIQPPGALHEVYTPKPSVTLGGHFYTADTMHLTEVARALDKKTQAKLTNQGHASSQATISIMLAALQFQSKPGKHHSSNLNNPPLTTYRKLSIVLRSPPGAI